jgi:transposase
VARQHGLHPSLLARWVKERTEPARMTVSSQASLVPQFVPLRVESAHCAELPTSARLSSKIEVNIDRGDLRIAFKVDSSQVSELGQVLREVLR